MCRKTQTAPFVVSLFRTTTYTTAIGIGSDSNVGNLFQTILGNRIAHFVLLPDVLIVFAKKKRLVFPHL